MKLYFVRHAQASSNINKKVQSAEDSLTEIGIEQTKKVAEALKDIQFDKIYCSKYTRTRQTADAITQYHSQTPIEYTDLLVEIHRGIYAGQQRTQEIHDELARITNSLYERPPEGESVKDVDIRIKQFVQQIIDNHQNDTILSVGHAGSMRHLIAIVQNIPFEEVLQIPEVTNASISIFTYENNTRSTQLLGDTSHLD